LRIRWSIISLSVCLRLVALPVTGNWQFRIFRQWPGFYLVTEDPMQTPKRNASSNAFGTARQCDVDLRLRPRFISWRSGT
jgi:hypothetical protein